MRQENSVLFSSSSSNTGAEFFSQLFSITFQLPPFFASLSLTELKNYLQAVPTSLSSVLPKQNELSEEEFYYWKGRGLEIIAQGKLVAFQDLSSAAASQLKDNLALITDLFPGFSPAQAESSMNLTSLEQAPTALNLGADSPAAGQAKSPAASFPVDAKVLADSDLISFLPEIISEADFLPIPTPEFLPLFLGAFRYRNLQGKMILPALILVRKAGKTFLWIGAASPALKQINPSQLSQLAAAIFSSAESDSSSQSATSTQVEATLATQSCPDPHWREKVAVLSTILRANSAQQDKATAEKLSALQQVLSSYSPREAPEEISATAIKAIAEQADTAEFALSDLAKLEKVVLSRSETYQLKKSTSVNISATLKEMGSKFPNCWVFKIDNYFGATPEILAAVNQGKLFCRVLAGSCAPGQETALAQDPKELREHQIARNSALDKLSPFFPDLSFNLEPKLLRLNNISHLASDIHALLPSGTGNLSAVPEEIARNTPAAAETEPKFLPDNALDIAALLHPTAAVCGKDEAVAKAYIDQFEELDRDFFAAPVGWLNAQGEGEWCIALRCVQYANHCLTFYGGAGIMGDSQAEQELKETKRKMEAMKTILLSQF